MATKTFYATRDLKNPSYGTRMLKAGDPVELDAPKARLYKALGAVTDKKPRAAAKPYDPREESVEQFQERKAVAPKAAPKAKRAPRKKAAAKK